MEHLFSLVIDHKAFGTGCLPLSRSLGVGIYSALESPGCRTLSANVMRAFVFVSAVSRLSVGASVAGSFPELLTN